MTGHKSIPASDHQKPDDELRAVEHAARGLKLRSDEQAGHDKRIRQSEDELAAWQKARREADTYMTVDERSEDQRIKLYFKLKARGRLDAYYLLYPTHRPHGEQDRARPDDERER